MEQRRCAGCMSVTEGTHCQHCGWPASKDNEPHQLPVGTVLRGQYMVGRVLGQGGFGITYLGWDAYLEAPVAIKEYYPNYMVSRDHTVTRYVRCYTAQLREQYAASKARFLREARTLAKFQDEPAVVHIRSCFEENDTAYIIMEYLHGETLADRIRRTGPMGAKGLLELLKPVMVGLEDVHHAHIVHRDISPDNIMILPDGRAKLVDFGAARDSSNGNTTETVVKHGFAPFEQYQNKGDLGPWTDVYALCATLWYCLTGRIPTEALTRVTEGEVMGWASVPGLSPAQCAALERGMAIRHKERTQSVRELMEGIFGPEEAGEDLRSRTEEALRRELAPKIAEELRRELGPQIGKELRVQIEKELRPQIEKELRRELKKAAPVKEPAKEPEKVVKEQEKTVEVPLKERLQKLTERLPGKEGAGRRPLILGLAAVVLVLAVCIGIFGGQKGWAREGNSYVYRNAFGTKRTSEWLNTDGVFYYFDGTGHMVTGFEEVGDYTYYFGKSDGRMRTDWQNIDGDIYYFGENDGRMRTGTVKIDGLTYQFTADGKLVGWPKGHYPKIG